MQPGFWEECLVDLQNDFDEQQFNTGSPTASHYKRQNNKNYGA